jgi:hypothetical protein
MQYDFRKFKKILKCASDNLTRHNICGVYVSAKDKSYYVTNGYHATKIDFTSDDIELWPAKDFSSIVTMFQS